MKTPNHPRLSRCSLNPGERQGAEGAEKRKRHGAVEHTA